MSWGELVVNITIALITGVITGVIVTYWLEKRDERLWHTPKLLLYTDVFEAVDSLLQNILPGRFLGIGGTYRYEFSDAVTAFSNLELKDIDKLREYRAFQEGPTNFTVQEFGAEMADEDLDEAYTHLKDLLRTPVPTVEPEFEEMMMRLRSEMHDMLEQIKMRSLRPDVDISDIDNLSGQEIDEKQKAHNGYLWLIDTGYGNLAEIALKIWQWLDKKATCKEPVQIQRLS